MADADGFTADSDDGFVADEAAPAVQQTAAAASPDHWWTPLAKYGSIGLQGLNKAMDLPRGALPEAAFISSTTGAPTSKLLTPQEHKNSNDIFTMDTAPTGAEMLERAGQPPGRSLSDLIPGAYKPATQGTFQFPPAKGGMLDPTARGAQGFALDTAFNPLSLLSFGSSGAAKDALAESATKKALAGAQGPVGKALDIVGSATQAPLKIAESPLSMVPQMVNQVPGGSFLTKAATWPSSMVQGLGNWMYKTGIRPIEAAGEKFGKKELADTYYKAGIKLPLNIPEKTQEAANILTPARNDILNQAGAAGGKVDMDLALQEAQGRANALKNNMSLAAQEEGKDLQAEIDEMRRQTAPTPATPGSPAIPAVTKEVRGPLDAGAWPTTQTQIVSPAVPAVPGTPQIPGKTWSPMDASAGASKIQNTELSPNAHRVDTRKTLPMGSKLSLGRGLREASNQAVEDALGPEARTNVEELNQDMGNLLTGRPAQEATSNKAQRVADRLVSTNSTDALIGAHSQANGGGDKGLQALLWRRLFDLPQILGMPTGYGIRKAGEAYAPLIDAATREKLLQYERSRQNGQN